MSKRAQLFFLICCIGWAIAIAILSLMQSPPVIPNKFLGWDKLQHAAAYALLAFLALHGGMGRSVSSPQRLLLSVVLFGALVEVAQGTLTQNRSADPLDLLANVVGTLVGYLSYRLSASFFNIRSLAPLFLTVMIAGAISSPMPAAADENIFNSTAAIQQTSERLVLESREVVTTPFGWENGEILATLLVAGSVAVTTQYDEDIRDEVAKTKGKMLDHATDWGSLAGDPFLHLGIAAAVYGAGVLAESPKYRELGEMFGEAAILADVTTLVLKQSIGRGRPSTGSDSGKYRMFRFQSDYDSLPSMHTASSFAMASIVSSAAENRLTALASYAAAAFVGFSRIYQDKHWASDVILGAAIGELCGRVVTRFHVTEGSRKITLAPVVSGSSAVVALVGRF